MAPICRNNIRATRDIAEEGPANSGAPVWMEPQFPTGGPCLLHDFWIYRDFVNALCGLQNGADPREVVADSGGPSSIGTSAAYVINEHGAGQFEGVALSDWVSFQKLQVRLLGSLPVGYRFEFVDVPANEAREGRGAMRRANHGSRVFQLDLACFRPFVSRAPQLERLRFSMDDHAILLDADIGGVAGPARRVFRANMCAIEKPPVLRSILVAFP